MADHGQSRAKAPLVRGNPEREEISRRIASIALQGKMPRHFWLAFAASFFLVMAGFAAVAWMLTQGVGTYGINIPVAWGTMITNYVWWIGIGNAGTLISALLLLFRQDWRASVNRFAEAMTLLAVAMAGLFPILHLGRPWFFYWLLPLPNTHMHWPNWRSPLVWDFAAIAIYGILSLCFWYIGMLPDLATMRDRAKSRGKQVFYGILALGWRGSAFHWARFQTVYFGMAVLATPLVVSVHSVVAIDFAFGITPGYHSTIYPPYFVAGALYSGFAMVLTITIPLRRLFRVEDLITERHIDNSVKIMLAAGMFVAYSYVAEFFFAWYSGEAAERHMAWARLTGPYAWTFWATLFCNVGLLQLLWIRRIRLWMPALFVIAILINVGMWIERYMIVVTGPSRSFLPATWGTQSLTWVDYGVLFGSLGAFLTLLFLFLRLLPAITIFEVVELADEKEGAA